MKPKHYFFFQDFFLFNNEMNLSFKTVCCLKKKSAFKLFVIFTFKNKEKISTRFLDFSFLNDFLFEKNIVLFLRCKALLRKLN